MSGARGVASAQGLSSLVVRAFGGLVELGLLVGLLMEFKPRMAAEAGAKARVAFDLGFQPAMLVVWIAGVIRDFLNIVHKTTG